MAKSATLNTGNHVNEEQNLQWTTTPTSAFNQMIEQINIALEQKGSGNFLAWAYWSSPSETNVRKESIYTSN